MKRKADYLPYVTIIAVVAVVAVVLLVLNGNKLSSTGEATRLSLLKNDYVSLKKLNNAVTYTEYFGDSSARSCDELCSLRGGKTCVDAYWGVDHIISGSRVQLWYAVGCSATTLEGMSLNCRCY